MLRNSGIDCDGDIEKLVEKTAEALTSEEILDKDINEVKEKSVKKAAESTVQEENFKKYLKSLENNIGSSKKK